MNNLSATFCHKPTLFTGLFLATSVLLSACGGGTSGTTAATSSSESLDITVERGPVLYSHVIDSTGIKANVLENNVYQFKMAPTYPIRAIGGFIDIDHSGDLSIGDVEMGNLTLEANKGQALTIGSTLATNTELLSLLATLGFTEAQLTQQTPTSDKMIAALSDEVYKYCIENNITEPSQILVTDFAGLADAIRSRMSDYIDSSLTAGELESNLITDLTYSGLINPLDSQDLEDINSETNSLSITQISFADTESPLTEAQQNLLAFSWNEEKMAKDLYYTLYELLLLQGTDIKAFYNVATKSETQHQEIMRGLLESYDMDISTGEILTGYKQDAISLIEPGTFPLAEVQTLYNNLYQYGTSGTPTLEQSALEAGCMVEVVDVEDLNNSIALAGDAYVLVSAFENLRSGSYNHYWAFNDALIAQGITQGCCVLGDRYCRTDFPKIPKGKQ